MKLISSTKLILLVVITTLIKCSHAETNYYDGMLSQKQKRNVFSRKKNYVELEKTSFYNTQFSVWSQVQTNVQSRKRIEN